ncbi:hypothetical protein KOI35_23790 [Actinoplanes bogorensis]|uniref:DUF2975 domain-containing protein n=1 Tax=Paractinoplanes bogorensis TaxID=1610840 RepID=A0ABS5YSV7_9ACTN|nr:hypothetical protein [Actinoplanes bogorensis]MBU2666534.1 hypothetical protein [Actinoplanes bogorensis]
MERHGQGHTCRSAHSVPKGPPLGWHVATWVTVGLCVLLAVCSMALSAMRLRLPPPGEPIPRTDDFLVFGLLSVAWFVLAAGVLIAFLVFGRSTRRVKERFSDETRWYERPRIVGRLYGAMVLVSILVQLFSGAGWRQILIAVTVVRIVGIALLAGSVLLTWARVLRLAADSAALSRAAAATPPPASRYSFPDDAGPGPDDAGPGPDSPGGAWPPGAASSPIVEQSRGLAPHKVPLTAQASEADWNPHHWDPEIEDDINRRRRAT